MSSMRNAVQRRNHKERSQPHERAKWGLLEKHRDYSLRAKDHNAKKRKIKALQEKASERNDDEFYFGMMSSKTRGGIKVSDRQQDNSGGQQGSGKSLSHDVVKLMKTQDCAYLRTVLQSTRRAADKLEEGLTTLEHGVPTSTTLNGKKVFTDDGDDIEEGRDADGDAEDDIESLDDLLALDQLDAQALQSKGLSKSTDQNSADRKRQHTIEVRQRQLEVLRERQSDLTVALREVEDQRARMSGTAGGVNKNGTKFKSRQRQR
ncbi:hypothetical protein AMS68_002546 [Peltaster fructicola]|uniref:U3 small nucleolar RNA-associated protein 11 n=1 Tax=Peltaster fructicola TaxID=286661 RepID=A0A6H0XQX9_9PEZI|nr:hypothetical protein AMS68_002546 [Peltaster fructicola]